MKTTRKFGLACAALLAVSTLSPVLAQDAGSMGRTGTRQGRRNRNRNAGTPGGMSSGMSTMQSGSMQSGSMSSGMSGMSTTAIGADFQATVDRAIATLDAMNRLVDANTARNNQLRQEYRQRTGQPTTL